MKSSCFMITPSEDIQEYIDEEIIAEILADIWLYVIFWLAMIF